MPFMPLPKTVADLMAFRKTKSARTLNDLVEAAYLKLYDNEKFNAYLNAVYDEQAVEGSTSIDNAMAALMIKELAKKDGVVELSSQKLASISKALNIVGRRYGFSRKERQNMLHGEPV
jgi:hypothetical protein